MKKLSRILAALIVTVGATVAQATLVWDFDSSTPVSLATLTSEFGGEIQVGDKLFSDFFTSVAATQGNLVLPPDMTSINIAGTQSNGEWGVVFNAGWTVRPGELLDTLLQFRVRTTDPSFYIVGNTLAITGNLNTTALGGLSVSESVYQDKFLGLGGNVAQLPLAVKQVHFNSIFDQQPYDHQSFVDPNTQQLAAVQEAWIVKDILLDGGPLVTGNTTGVVALSGVIQTFAQIPEPASLALIAAGSLLIVGGRRRMA